MAVCAERECRVTDLRRTVADVDDTDQIRQWVRRRIPELEARREELFCRGGKSPGAGESHSRVGLDRARESAARALDHAWHAHANSRKAHIAAARIHEEAAWLYERMAEAGIDETGRYRRRAEFHRLMAAKERRCAEEEPGEPCGGTATSPGIAGAGDPI